MSTVGGRLSDVGSGVKVANCKRCWIMEFDSLSNLCLAVSTVEDDCQMLDLTFEYDHLLMGYLLPIVADLPVGGLLVQQSTIIRYSPLGLAFTRVSGCVACEI